jgi:hypothetical protein
VLWLLALLAAITGLTPLGLVAMLFSVPVLLVRFKLREKAEQREIALGYRRFDGTVIRNCEATQQRENPPITKGDRYTADGHEINWTPRTFAPVQPEQLMNNLVPSRYYAHLYERHDQAEQMFLRFMPEI